MEQEIQEKVEQEQGAGVRKEDLPEYQKYVHLRGQTICISKAKANYKIPDTTLRRWIKWGLIKIIKTEKNKILVDEADVAYCSELYIKHRRKGHIVFKRDGTLHQPKRKAANL